MTEKKTIFLVWEFQIATIETAKVQLQVLRAIASTSKIADIYKTSLTKLKGWQFSTRELWFEVEEREIDHCFGIEDLERYISRNRV
jgi:hypothetical protein